jgi:prepilin-type N-terminal cleavage/methylation domain-containing protein
MISFPKRNSAPRAGDPLPEERNRRSGFTVVELVVAVVVLSVGLLGLAGTSAVVLKQMKGAKTQLSASQIAASRIEKLSGTACLKSATLGTATANGVTESWTVAPTDNETMTAVVSVTFAGRTNPEQFNTVIACF